MKRKGEGRYRRKGADKVCLCFVALLPKAPSLLDLCNFTNSTIMHHKY